MTKKRQTAALTTHAVARLCGVSPPTVVRWIERGRLDAFRTPGGHRRVLQASVVAFCREQNIPIGSLGQTQHSILVVDDEPIIRSSMLDLLCRLAPGVHILTAEDAFQAGQLYATHKPALVFLDLMLPGLNGLRFYERVLAEDNGKETHVVAITGAKQYGLEERVARLGIDRFLRKPFNTVAVEHILAECLPAADHF